MVSSNPIDKDTKLHPLVRWQFLGGLAEDKRRAFLFTDVTDAKGRRYDMPVAVGALAASPDIYAAGMGQPVDSIGAAWIPAIAKPMPPVAVYHRAMPGGGDHRRRFAQPRRRAGAAAGAGVKPGLRCRALPDRDAMHHPRYRHRDAEPGHVPGGAEGDRPLAVRMVAAALGGAGGYYHLAQIPHAARAESGYRTEVVVTGPRPDLDKAMREGKVDLLTMHSGDITSDLVADGFGVNLRPWTRNELCILGPPDDPAHIRGMTI